jgi:acetolactate synthase-1/2/3 large subunit
MHNFNKFKSVLSLPYKLVRNQSSSIGAKIVYNELINKGITLVTGYPGGAILPVLDQFAEQDKIKFIQNRTESGAGSMAEGYAKATGKPGVIMVTSGPGAINIMTCMQNASSDGTAVMALTGQVSTAVIGTDAFQEADVIGISKPCTKWNNQITNGTKIQSTFKTAFNKMLSGRHGPVLIDLPKNIMSLSYEQENVSVDELVEKGKSTIVAEDINKMINQSKRPVILAGQGVIQSDAIDLLRRIATFYNIPVTTTLMGLGVFDENNCQSLKMIGMHGSYYANMAIQNCDLLINFGSRFDDRIIGDPTKFAPKAKIVHVDISSKNINKVIKADYYINGNCKDVLHDMIEYRNNDVFEPYKFNDWHDQINKWRKVPFSYPKKNVLQGRHVIATLNKIIQKNQITDSYTIVADVGAHQMWAAQFIDYNYPKVKFITSGGLGQMGFALPASMGVKMGLPTNTVICICGDGGFSMSFNELITAIEHKIDIKVIIINNNYQLMVKMWQEKFYNNRIIGTKMFNPPFELMCKAMGCEAVKIDSNENLEQKLNEFLNYKGGPIVANVITDENETVLPMVSPGKALDDMIIDDNINEKFEGDAPC